MVSTRRVSVKKILLISLLLFVVLPKPLHAKRVALVIGNGGYKLSPLNNPVNDANDMAATLETLDFSVIKVTNANLRSMNKALSKFTRDLNKGDVALFFFAGHGVQVHGENYLLPVGNQIETSSDIRYEALPVGRMIGRLEVAETMNIVILDACRNNPFGRGFNRSLDRGLAVILRKPEGTFIAYATAPGKTAADGDGDNGLFTSALLKHMNQAGSNISTILRKVRADVKKHSFGEQIPWSESSLTEEFFFKVKITPTSQEIEARIGNVPPEKDSALERLFWESIKESKDPSTYKAYLNEFPQGFFRTLAILKIQQLEKASVGAVVPPENKFKSNTSPKMEKENQAVNVASLPVAKALKAKKLNSGAIVQLRKKPAKVSKNNLIRTIEKYDFFEKSWNRTGSFKNNFVEMNDEIAVDKSTGLIWQKSGTLKSVRLRQAESYINRLNEQKYNGYNDWRLPTLAELASLLKLEKVKGLHIDAVFDGRQLRLWSSDISKGLEGYEESYDTNFILHLERGVFARAIYKTAPTTLTGFNVMSENFARAVRSENVISD